MATCKTRIERLEKRVHRNRLIVLAIDSDGVEVQEGVSEMIDHGHSFQKVIGGDDMEDLRRTIDYFIFSASVAEPGTDGGIESVHDTSALDYDRYLTKEFRDKAKQRAARSPIIQPVEIDTK